MDPLFITTQCWKCGTIHDCTSQVKKEGSLPKNGDVSLCFECGAFAIFDDSFEDRIRKPTPSENFNLERDQELLAIRALWAIMIEKRKRDALQDSRRRKVTPIKDQGS